MDVDAIIAGLSEADHPLFSQVGTNQPDGTCHLLNEYSRYSDVKAWGRLEDLGLATAQVYFGDGVGYTLNATGLAVRARLLERKDNG